MTKAKGHTILLVDDSVFDRDLMKAALNRTGEYQFVEASNGEECLAAIERGAVDLVLMDILMPGMPGTDVLRKVRERFNAVELPVIMVTSRSDTADVVAGLQAGANDYIAKPVSYEVARSRIETHLKLGELSREMARLTELAALDAMITTYNHEINNPLAIAITCLERLEDGEKSVLDQLKAALWRVADVVKKIRDVTQKREAEYRDYAGARKMVKI
jgi:PleD family two-component response regulator